MKKWMNFLFLLLAFPIFGQEKMPFDSTGLAGDQFDLPGTLALFQNSTSPEDFENKINDPNNHVNNLDLNEDGEIDYVRVVSQQDGDVNVFALQVPMSASESQDIAAIELEKTGSETAIIQVVGDEDIFGDDYYIEPFDSAEYDYNQNNKSVQNQNVTLNIWAWPSVRYVYGPAYRPWISPWGWKKYPNYWKPWRPFTWSVWHPYRVHHRPNIRVVHTVRIPRAHSVYRTTRVTSRTVNTRYAGAHANYKVSRSKTKVTTPRGNKISKTSTTVHGKRGSATKTTVHKSRKGHR